MVPRKSMGKQYTDFFPPWLSQNKTDKLKKKLEVSDGNDYFEISDQREGSFRPDF